MTSRSNLLKRLARHSFIFARRADDPKSYPAITVTDGYGADPEDFVDLGGWYGFSRKGLNADKRAWVIEHDAALGIMTEMRPMTYGWRAQAIDTWLQS